MGAGEYPVSGMECLLAGVTVAADGDSFDFEGGIFRYGISCNYVKGEFQGRGIDARHFPYSHSYFCDSGGIFRLGVLDSYGNSGFHDADFMHSRLLVGDFLASLWPIVPVFWYIGTTVRRNPDFLLGWP